MLDEIVRPLNRQHQDKPRYTLGEFVREKYLPFYLRGWKDSTASTSKNHVEHHLVKELGDLELTSFRREQLQEFLQQKAGAGLSGSVVGHLRWHLRAIFQLAVEDNVVDRNPATSLMIPTTKAADARVMTREDVVKVLSALDLRERLISRLAIFAGMRPGEIFGLK